VATSYAEAVRTGSMAASRLHVQLGMREKMKARGGNIDVFTATLDLDVPLILRKLDGLLGAYMPEPISGILVTTERPLSIQRFTAAHELGHHRLAHLPSLDNEEDVLRRMAMPGMNAGPNMQEVEADAFAVTFLMPKWLIAWHCQRQGWLARDLAEPSQAYQLALRLGASYEATTWTLERHRLIGPLQGRALRSVQPRQMKADLLREYRPKDYRGDVWLLSERDAGTRIDGSRNDHFVLRLNEHSGGGYLWNIEELRTSGLAIVRDDRETVDHEGIGGPVTRSVTAALEQAQRGEISLAESRPWQPSEPITELYLEYDFTGPEEEGLSRVERRHLLEAA
jgi:Zn-dependent peptidase ImmA (M78 family)/predicted secreted protein